MWTTLATYTSRTELPAPAIVKEAQALAGYSCTPHLGIGSLGSGLRFHSYGDAWAEQLHGRKKWLFCPPGCAEEARARGFAGTVADLSSRPLARNARRPGGSGRVGNGRVPAGSGHPDVRPTQLVPRDDQRGRGRLGRAQLPDGVERVLRDVANPDGVCAPLAVSIHSMCRHTNWVVCVYA